MFRVKTDEEQVRQLFLEWVVHLDILGDRMKEFNVEANIGKPQVAYRENISKDNVEIEGKFVRQSGGRGHLTLLDSFLSA